MERPMNVVFRADASLDIGSGHVMRCLTLANALKMRGCKVSFICRSTKGNMISFIETSGFSVFPLPPSPQMAIQETLTGRAIYQSWLGVSADEDASQTIAQLQPLTADWLIVDHYGIDVQWETLLRSHCHKLMVIDDLADRQHECDLLLDQSLGREASAYLRLAPAECRLAMGADYALLRPEFALWRDESLRRRTDGVVSHILISMGGIDKNNATSAVLSCLKTYPLAPEARITVVMGSHAPWLEAVERMSAKMPVKADIRVNVEDMAHLMTESDLSIGAAGSSAWERCCLGLPSIIVVQAENQIGVAKALEKHRCAKVLPTGLNIDESLPKAMRAFGTPSFVREMQHNCMSMIDGDGVQRICTKIFELGGTS
ncbi:UDP-2,4-diacetamido-2,4,6-trideoxy-beta-L-altropyranose hydrolase [uncultured Cohaesibacter sp.]|uniref:UDP-2,4-diacetamido-2,4, 6-trideoxy-beta-L-altropyranose hydrolase n=1 Tax=uncultured Cohaesibacter sp. TaxID=1002546 RepID=UPI002AA73448|nr:UDP-2,4-diacetamido-2,4,6-trideoxy-beta-L-altropyranose hydrolase [uncultured Cohaesibacter sp.]